MKRKFLIVGILTLFLISFSFSGNIDNIDSSYTGFLTSGCEEGYDYCKTGEYYNTSIKSNPTGNDAIKVTRDGEYIVMKPSEIFYTEGESEQMISTTNSVNGSLIKYNDVNNSKVHYENIFGEGIHLEYAWTETRLLKFLVIDSFDDLPRLDSEIFSINSEIIDLVFNEQFELSPDLDVYIDGIKWDKEKKEETNSEVILKKSNETIMVLPKPYMKDANNEFKNIKYILRKKSGKLKIAVSVPYEFLVDAVYPILIDPTIESGVGSAGATDSSSQRHIVRNSTGEIHVAYTTSAGATYANSTDNGATWNGKDVINAGCNYPAIDINVTGELLVVCNNEDSYISYPPHTAAWVSTTGGAPPGFVNYPDLDIDNVTGNATVACTDGAQTLEYWEAASPYSTWTSVNPTGGAGIAPVGDGSVDVALNFTGTYVCIGYQDQGLMGYYATCCQRSAGNCSTDSAAWSTPVELGVSDTAAGSCAFDENGNLTCAYINANIIKVSTLDIVSMTVIETTTLDSGNKLTCNEVSLSVYNSTEQYLTASCYDGTRGTKNDIFVANRSSAKHWGYPQKESTWVSADTDDLTSPSSPSFWNISDSVFEWIYTESAPGADDVEYDNATWSSPTTSFCGGSYTGGDWTVAAPTLCENETIWFDNGSTLTVNSQLTLNNITLKISAFSDGDSDIIVNSGGSLLINDTYAYSTVEQGYCPLCYYTFNAESGSVLSINGSVVNNAGYATSYVTPYRGVGLWINTSSIWINNASISGRAGISFFGSAMYGLSNIFINDTVISTTSRHGIYAYNTSSSAFNLMNITTPDTRDGIRLRDGAQNNIIENSSIDTIRILTANYNLVNNVTATGNRVGIVLITDSNYNNITNNTVHTASAFHGINLDNGCDYNIIENNVVHSNPAEGIYLHTNNGFNNITNNTVYGNGNSGIIFDNYEHNNTILNNTIHNNSGNIIIQNSNQNTIDNNVVSGNISGGGMNIQSSNYTTVQNNTISENPISLSIFTSTDGNYTSNTISNCNYGLYISTDSSSNIFLNNTIYDCYRGLYVTNSDVLNREFANSTITNATVYDVEIDTASDVTLLNVTFNKSNTNILDTSTLTVRWYATFGTVDSFGTTIPFVNITSRDVGSILHFYNLTDVHGNLTQDIPEFLENSSYRHNYSDYTFNGEKSAFTGTTVSRSVTDNIWLELTLAPTVSGGSEPNGGGGGADGIYYNVTILSNPEVFDLLIYFANYLDVPAYSKFGMNYNDSIMLTGGSYLFDFSAENYKSENISLYLDNDTILNVNLTPLRYPQIVDHLDIPEEPDFNIVSILLSPLFIIAAVLIITGIIIYFIWML